MALPPDTASILRRHLHDPSSSFSIGSFGAIAEFHRDPQEALSHDDPERLTIATDRGGLRIELTSDAIPLAYETLSGRRGRWQQGVVFCLREELALSEQRTVLSELGPDRDAIRPEDRDAVLFDMGLGACNVDFCIRTGDPALLRILRRESGRSLFAPGNSAMPAILAANPHRIALSSLGRAEVYQAIGREKTPEGPHTHVLPKFLKSGRTHSANIPVPRGYLPCLSLYPANPLADGNGRAKPFDPRHFDAFQTLLKCWGPEAYRTEKARAEEALKRGEDPTLYLPATTRLGRTALRVAVRQAAQVDLSNPAVADWSRVFDAPKGRKPGQAAE